MFAFFQGALPLKEIPYGPIDKSKPKGQPKAKSKFVPLFSEHGKQMTTAAQLPGLSKNLNVNIHFKLCIHCIEYHFQPPHICGIT